MEINYDKWKNRWSSNEIIVLVLLSLGMQIGLIVLAPLRKRSKNPLLKLTLWLLYLTADSVAILALGNISNQADPEQSAVDSGTMPGKLTVLWVPFLLVHLGGPDSITSYSVEDNELWWRHLLGLVVQVVVTIYVFWQSPPKGLMWIPTMLVFIPGLIKFAERTHALRLGSKDNLKDKILSDLTIGKDQDKVLTDSVWNGHGVSTGETNENQTGTSTSEQQAVSAVQTTGQIVSDSARNSQGDSNGETNNNQINTSNSQQHAVPVIEPKDGLANSETESMHICEGYRWFNKFKRLLVDVTFESNLLMQSQDRFSEMNAKDALNMVAIELSFMYDILHTKAVHMHKIVGRVLRWFSLLSIIAALIVFLHLDRQKYASKDIIITYILFGAGLTLEVIAGVLLISSDWAVVSIGKEGSRKCIADAITLMVKAITFRKGKSRWSRKMGQFSLVGLCLRERYTPTTWIMKKIIIIKRKWDNMRESRSIPLSQGTLEDIMFTEAKRRAQNVHIYKVLVEARAYRGNKTLERHNQLETLEWSMKREFDESIILWHVATDICYYEDETSNKPNGEKQESSNQPNRENKKPSNQPTEENQEASNQPNVRNEELSNQPNVRNEELSNQPNGRKKIPIIGTCGLKSCLFEPSKQPTGKDDNERDVSWKTSNYMIYLLTQQQSMMQLGYGKTRFDATCSVVKKILQDKRKKDYEALIQQQSKMRLVWTAIKNIFKGQKITDLDARKEVKDYKPALDVDHPLPERLSKDHEKEMGELVLRDCCRLANELKELKPEIKWKLISETWMEMLGYAAIHCDSYQHAKSLRRGGELLTHLWLLMSQLGVVEEHKVQQYQSATVCDHLIDT